MAVMSATQPRPVLRPSAARYALFCGVTGTAIAAAAGAAITQEEPWFWFPAAVLTLVMAGLICWLATTTLRLAGNVIRYRSLFVAKDIPLPDIAGVRFVYGFESGRRYQRLMVTIRGQRRDREIVLNLGLFSRADIQRWLEDLNAYL